MHLWQTHRGELRAARGATELGACFLNTVCQPYSGAVGKRLLTQPALGGRLKTWLAKAGGRSRGPIADLTERRETDFQANRWQVGKQYGEVEDTCA